MTWLYFVVMGVALTVGVIFYLMSREEETKADEMIAEARKLERLQEGLLKQEVDADLLPILMDVMSESKVRLDELERRFVQEVLTPMEIEELTKLRVSLRIMQLAASKHMGE